MSIPSLRVSSPIDDILAFCRQHPAKGIDPAWLIAQLSSGMPAIVDRRDLGIVGLILDKGRASVSHAGQYEVIGGTLRANNATAFFATLLDQAAGLGLAFMEIGIEKDLAACTSFLTDRGGQYFYSEGRLHCAALQPLGMEALPADWFWMNAGLDHAADYHALRELAFADVPGVLLVPGMKVVDQLQGHRARLLYAPSGLIGALRVDMKRQFILMLMRHPDYHGKGIGCLLMDETARLLGRQASLNVVNKNIAAIALYRRYGFTGNADEANVYLAPTKMRA